MFKLFKKNGGGDPVDTAAEVCAARQVEIERLERERRELLAQRLEAEDDAGDVRAIDKLLKESERQIELAHTRLEKAHRELKDAAAAEVSLDRELLPELQRAFQRDEAEAAAKAQALAELAARWFDAAMLPEPAAGIRAACVDRLSDMGFVGAANLYGRARQESEGILEELQRAVGAPPDDLRERKGRVADLDTGMIGFTIQRRWKRALGARQREAGIKHDPFAAWQKKQRALEGRV